MKHIRRCPHEKFVFLYAFGFRVDGKRRASVVREDAWRLRPSGASDELRSYLRRQDAAQVFAADVAKASSTARTPQLARGSAKTKAAATAFCAVTSSPPPVP